MPNKKTTKNIKGLKKLYFLEPIYSLTLDAGEIFHNYDNAIWGVSSDMVECVGDDRMNGTVFKLYRFTDGRIFKMNDNNAFEEKSAAQCEANYRNRKNSQRLIDTVLKALKTLKDIEKVFKPY